MSQQESHKQIIEECKDATDTHITALDGILNQVKGSAREVLLDVIQGLNITYNKLDSI